VTMISRGIEISIAGSVVAMIRAKRWTTGILPYASWVRGI